MATTLTLSHPQFMFVFAAVRHTGRNPYACLLRTVTSDEHAMYRPLALLLASHQQVAEVCA